MIRKKGPEERHVLLFISIPQAAESKLQLPLRKSGNISSKLPDPQKWMWLLDVDQGSPVVTEPLGIPCSFTPAKRCNSSSIGGSPASKQWKHSKKSQIQSSLVRSMNWPGTRMKPVNHTHGSAGRLRLLGSSPWIGIPKLLATHCILSSPGSLLRTKPLDLTFLTSSLSFRTLPMVIRSVSPSRFYPKFCFQSWQLEYLLRDTRTDG